MNKTLKWGVALLGIASVAGATAYVLTQTEQGRNWCEGAKKKAKQLKENLQDEVGALKPYVCFSQNASEPRPFVEPLVFSHTLNEEKTRSVIICDRQHTIWNYYVQGFDAETIADLLNLSYQVVLEDIQLGIEQGIFNY